MEMKSPPEDILKLEGDSFFLEDLEKGKSSFEVLWNQWRVEDFDFGENRIRHYFDFDFQFITDLKNLVLQEDPEMVLAKE